ncbi:MAG TPA: hypothetical protein VEI97_17600, partial [bacterium]|nr:hypothetical protein [bacterium]
VLAETTIPFPPMGYGEVVYEIRGSRVTAPGKNRSEEEIRRGTKVRMVGKEGPYFLIQPLDEAELMLLARLTELDELTSPQGRQRARQHQLS